MEGTVYKWSNEKTRQLVRLRQLHDARFTKRRNAAKAAWEFLLQEMGLEWAVTPKQASKKWENLKKKYKELSKPGTGSGADRGEETASTWPFYADLHHVLGSSPSIPLPPMLVSSVKADPTIVTSVYAEDRTTITSAILSSCQSPDIVSPSSPRPSTSHSPAPSSNVPRPKRRKPCPILEFLREEAEREERRHSELSAQNERFLKAFEELVHKL